MNPEIKAIQDEIERQSAFVERFLESAGTVIVGQKNLLKSLLMTLLAQGHLLIEGLPGLAKTLTAHTFAQLVQCAHNRIQFTPDLLPSDITGTLIYNQREGSFETKKGPIFTQILLADEINRSPAKVQSALLEAMQERQVTLGDKTYALPFPFLVIATENPIEQEGTYPLPEAQVDRFMFKVKIDYPTPDEETEILKRMSVAWEPKLTPVVTPDEIRAAQAAYDRIYVDEKLYRYVTNLLAATRRPERYGLKDLEGMVQYGVSPRAGIFLIRAAKANAFLAHRGYTTPEDIREVGIPVLAHRLIPTYEAEAEELKREEIILRVLDTVEVP